MSFKPVSIILLLATGYFHYNALAFPAPVNPSAPSQTPETTNGLPNLVLADINPTEITPAGNGLATIGGDQGGKNVEPGKTNDPNGKTGVKTTPKANGGKSSKAAGLTEAELVEACAPLLEGKSGVTKTETPKKVDNLPGGKVDGLGGKVDNPNNGGVVPGKNTSNGGKTTAPSKKSSASISMRSSLVTTALPMILSTGVGLLMV